MTSARVRALMGFGALLYVSLALAAAQNPSPDSPPARPTDYSGMYAFLRDGEFLQVNVEDQGHLTGFVSRYGDLDSDRGVFLDQFFKKGKLEGNKLSFVTETVHGVWYEFKGAVERGEGKNPGDEAYYMLKGTLTQYNTDADKKTTSKAHDVAFKSFPADLGAGPPRD